LIERLYALRYHQAREQVTEQQAAQAKDALPEAEKLKSAQQSSDEIRLRA
jgi:hypothetical protein